jgi:catechol 2,3-dioxygenase-like lactoylglutathione lyase family enzyme
LRRHHPNDSSHVTIPPFPNLLESRNHCLRLIEMFDHILIHVSDIPASRVFYTAVLTTLGHKVLVDRGDSGVHAYGTFSPKFCVVPASPDKKLSGPVHIAFEAKDTAEVDAFHEAGLKVGAKSNGAPGPRPQYLPDIYACFLFDADGNNIECRCHVSPA